MNIRTAKIGEFGVDTIATLTAQNAKALRDANVDFVVRYLSSIRPDELNVILAAGLSLSLVTYCRSPGWTPSKEMGQADGAMHVLQLAKLNIPKGATVWLDVEGPSGPDVAAYVNAWAALIKAAGYDAGLYVGYGISLDAEALYGLSVDRYWRSESFVTEPTCGWSMMQLHPGNQVFAGVEVDFDIVQEDYRARTPMFVTA